MAHQQPPLVPPDALRDLLIEILTEFMAGTREQVIAFAASGASQLKIQETVSEPVLRAFRYQGAEIAAAMDRFFGQYGVTWNGAGYYNFPAIPAQQERWFNLRVEDINSTRGFVVREEQDPVHTIYNLARMIKYLGEQLAGPGGDPAGKDVKSKDVKGK